VSFAALPLRVTSERVFIVVFLFGYRLSPETFGYALVHQVGPVISPSPIETSLLTATPTEHSFIIDLRRRGEIHRRI